jgi:hypothetical protein
MVLRWRKEGTIILGHKMIPRRECEALVQGRSCRICDLKKLNSRSYEKSASISIASQVPSLHSAKLLREALVQGRCCCSCRPRHDPGTERMG